MNHDPSDTQAHIRTELQLKKSRNISEKLNSVINIAVKLNILKE
jgi:hypothetical protein